MMIKFLVYDFGLYMTQANALADGGKNRVKYFTPWAGRDPHYKDYIIGKGFEYLEKELYFEPWKKWADVIVFFDVSGNSICHDLREQYGDKKSIWGCGKAELLENDRVLFKEWCKELGLDVNKYVVVKGVTELKKELKKSNGNRYVKVQIFRGDVETFFCEDYDSGESIIDQEIIPHLGVDKEDFEFIVEEPIDKVAEPGADIFFNKHGVLGGFYGYEVDKALYIGKRIDDELPEPLQETLDAFTPLLVKLGYAGALSTEEVFSADGKHIWIDACQRIPNPLGALYGCNKVISNWPEFVAGVGRNEYIRPEINFKYVGAFPVSSCYAKDSYVKVDIKDEDKVKYQICCAKEKIVKSVPGWEVVGVLLGWGNTVDEVINMLKENAEYIKGHGVDTSPVNAIDNVKEVIEKGKKVGINF